MTPEIGTGLVMASLVAAAAGSALGFQAGARRSLALLDASRWAALAFAGLMILANLVMVGALLNHDFSVKYVAEVGSLSTPIPFTIVSLWASLDGSILFWGGILGVYVLVFTRSLAHRHREYMPWTLGVLLATCVFFALLVAGVANPFERVPNPPTDGPGPNPLLQNHWLMIVHPPTLYLGYVGMVVPFSMICAALFAGRLEDGWMVPLRRWMLVPWTFLTIGIVLGGWWSYGVLGWGGYWAWDPVENASFHPWLTGTAFLHSAMVFQKRGGLRIWTLALGMATFLLTLVGTFMTRSGVFNSVHSFTQSPIGPVFLAFIAIVLLFSVVLLATREHLLVVEDDHAETTTMSGVFGFEVPLLSREAALLAQNALFTVFTFTVLLGTLYPLIAEAVDGRKVSLGEPYFDRWALPLGLLMVFLMGVGPALPWGRMSPSRVAPRLGVPALLGVVFAVPFAVAGFTSPIVLATLALCGFAIAVHALEFWTPWRARAAKDGWLQAARTVFRRTRKRWGGHIAHHGVALLVVTIALSKGYKQEQDVTLHPGEAASIGRHTVRYLGSDLSEEPHRTSVGANFAVVEGDTALARMRPHLNYYPTQREPIYTPEVYSTLRDDLYLSIVEIDKDGTYVVLRMIAMPGMLWMWLAGGVILLGSLIVAWPDGRRTRIDAALARTGSETPA